MELTIQQQQAIKSGYAVSVNIVGEDCIVVRRDVFDCGEELDYSPWTESEMDLLAAEAADFLHSDGLDESDTQ